MSKLTFEILHEALCNYYLNEVDELEVNNFKTTERTGENFTSTIATVSVEVRIQDVVKDVELFVKMIPDEENKAIMARQGNIFKKECDFFRLVVPKMPFPTQIPQVYYLDCHDGVILMENLLNRGFATISKSEGLNLEQIKLILEHLSLFHAATYDVLQKEGESLAKSFPGLLSKLWMGDFPREMRNFFCQLLIQKYSSNIDIVRRTNPELAKRMRKFMPFYLKNYNEYSKMRGDFLVIIHGDAWAENFLFRYEEQHQKLAEIKLIDFQLVRKNNPTADLAYLLTTSSSVGILSNHLDHLLDYYYELLSSNLETLGYDIGNLYPFDVYKDDFDKSFIFGYTIGNFSIPMAFVKKSTTGFKTAKDWEQSLLLRKRLVELSEEAARRGII